MISLFYKSNLQQSEVQNGDETMVTTTEKVLVGKSGKKKSVTGEHVKSGTTIKKKSKKSKKSSDLEKENISVVSMTSDIDHIFLSITIVHSYFLYSFDDSDSNRCFYYYFNCI